MGLDDFCNTGLVLGLGFSSTGETQKSTEINQKPNKQGFNFDHQLETMTKTVSINLEPSLTLSLPCESRYEYDHRYHHQEQVGNNTTLPNHAITKVQSVDLYRQDSGGTSSFSNVSVKREREFGSEDGETKTDQRIPNSKASDEDDDASNGRKKLRLSKAQSAFLEECFKQHNTLNPKQKQELAKELKLRPRQVEVWFQNRRARTKLKQTEMDYEFLKKCCETLTDENRRLQKELHELKAVKLAQPLYMQLPAATLTTCPSCERIGGTVGVGHDNTSNNSLVTMAPKTHFYNHFPNPSAAC